MPTEPGSPRQKTGLSGSGEERIRRETLDVTMPGRAKTGKKHPITIVLDEIKDIFLGMGYEIAEGPELS